jgi:hypothetical protein
MMGQPSTAIVYLAFLSRHIYHKDTSAFHRGVVYLGRLHAHRRPSARAPGPGLGPGLPAGFACLRPPKARVSTVTLDLADSVQPDREPVTLWPCVAPLFPALYSSQGPPICLCLSRSPQLYAHPHRPTSDAFYACHSKSDNTPAVPVQV